MKISNKLKKSKMLRRLYRLSKNKINWIKNYSSFIGDYFLFKRNNDGRFKLDWSNRFPCLGEATADTSFDAHYIYHPAWAARILAKNKPEFHIDISSSLTFCSLVSAFIPVKFYDYRPANLKLSGLETGQANLLKLPFANNSVKSLSCMHTIEHVGLGRYGDPIDPTGDLKAMAELNRVLAPGGNLLFVVPIGQAKLMFNAHRIYSYRMIIDTFKDLKLNNFTLIPSSNKLRPNFAATKEESDKEEYACGCFWFTK
jgi:SAM-dependent methyltransferase